MQAQSDFAILHSCGAPGRKEDGTFYLPTTPETSLWGRIPGGAARPVLSMPQGGILVVDSVSHEGLLEDQGAEAAQFLFESGVPKEEILSEALDIFRRTSRVPKEDGPHLVAGPVFVEGAEPGDILKVEILRLSPRVPYAVSSCRGGRGVLAGELPRQMQGARSKLVPIEMTMQGFRAIFETQGAPIEIPLRPFFGILGTAGLGEENPNSIPPSPQGGNIDIAEFSENSAAYFPVSAQGALFYAGDPHFAQGNGEVSLTALEGSLRGIFRLSVIKDAASILPGAEGLGTFFGETATHWIFAGLGESLDDALRNAVRSALHFAARQFSIPEEDAYLYLGAAADFSVSQAVNRTKGIHAAVPKAHFLRFLTFHFREGPSESAPQRQFSASTDGTEIFARIEELPEQLRSAIPKARSGGRLIALKDIPKETGFSVVWTTEGRRAVGTIWRVQ